MINAIQEYIRYLHDVKQTSHNTELCYERDLKKAADYFAGQEIENLLEVTPTNLNSYMLYLEREQLSPATVSRNVAALKSFFRYLVQEHRVAEDPTGQLKPPKVEKKAPCVLTIEEAGRLLRQPDRSTAKGIRDSAMLELLYATGIRVSELIHLKTGDVNLPLGYITCTEHERDRIIPFGETAGQAMRQYLETARDALLKGGESEYFFTNCSGKPMSRLVFDGVTGDGIQVTLVDMGDHFRIICADIELVKQPEPMPKLPVARIMYRHKPDFRIGTAAWCYAGGAHHSVVSTALTRQDIAMFARLTQTELITIGEDTTEADLQKFFM